MQTEIDCEVNQVTRESKKYTDIDAFAHNGFPISNKTVTGGPTDEHISFYIDVTNPRPDGRRDGGTDGGTEGRTEGRPLRSTHPRIESLIRSVA